MRETSSERHRAIYSRRSVLRLAVVAIPSVATFTLMNSGPIANAAVTRTSATTRLTQALYSDGFTIGSTKPTSYNTGVSSSIALTRYDGNLTITRPGVYENFDIFGYVFVRASDVTLRNCRIRGPLSGRFVTYGLVDCRSGLARNVLIERCTIRPDTKKTMWWVNGVSITSGATVTVRRCNIYHTVDGINGGDGSGTVIRAEGNYIHDRAFFNNCLDHINDRYHPYWTHNDGIQLSGGAGHKVVGNNLQAYIAPFSVAGFNDGIHGVPSYANYGAGITVSPDKGSVTATTVSSNWFESGNAGFQMNYLTPWNMNFGTISSNRFGMDQYAYGSTNRYQIRFAQGAIVAGLTTNYFDPDAPSVPTALRGVMFGFGYLKGIRVGD